MSEHEIWCEMMVAKTAEVLHKFRTVPPKNQKRMLQIIDDLILSESVSGEPIEDSTEDFLKELKALLEKEAKTI